MFVIDKILLGSPSHLSVSDSYRWVNCISSSDFYIGPERKPCNFLPLLKIYNRSIPEFISQAWKDMFSTLGLQNPPWFRCLPRGKYLDHLNAYVKALKSAVDPLLSHKYIDTFVATQKLLMSLCEPEINYEKAKLYLCNESNPTIQSNIKSFLNQTSLVPVYDRSATTTGRLVVERGPRILTLPSKYRNIIRNSWQIDFVSMEPNFLLAISGISPDRDVYHWIANKLNLNLDRKKVKLLVIKSMYGDNYRKDPIIRKIEKLLNLDIWIEELSKACKDDILENYFGRPIFTKGVTGKHLLALWLQSSATDAALLGFKNFFEQNPSCRAHFIIHDGAVFSTGSVPQTDKLHICKNIDLPVDFQFVR